jgi:hypothetical protein
MIENSIYFVGPFLLSDMAGPNLDKVLKGYQVPFKIKSPIDDGNHGHHKVYSRMQWDLRNTRSPVIDNGNIDLFMMGELKFMDKDKDAC